jgi:hypothetical protein
MSMRSTRRVAGVARRAPRREASSGRRRAEGIVGRAAWLVCQGALTGLGGVSITTVMYWMRH